MSNRRYNNSKVYLEFVSHAKRGDELLEGIFNKMVDECRIVGEDKGKLIPYVKSNEFLSKFKVPFKYKGILPALQNAQLKGPVNKRCKNINGDIVECYLCWLHENYGEKAVVRYIENEIIRITS